MITLCRYLNKFKSNSNLKDTQLSENYDIPTSTTVGPTEGGLG